MLALEVFLSGVSALARATNSMLDVSVTLRPPCLCNSSRVQTWRLHTKRYEFVWHTSSNNARMRPDFLSVCLYSNHLSYAGFLTLFMKWLRFRFDHMKGENREFSGFRWEKHHVPQEFSGWYVWENELLVCLTIYLFASLFVHVSMCLSVCLSVCLPVSLSRQK